MRWARLVASLAMLAALGLTPAHAATDPAPAARNCAALVSSSGPARVCIAAESFDRDVCTAIERLSAEYGLPAGYFARLIWQESRFNPGAVSPAGAQGIAQFMPGTARLRGLRNAFAPAEALIRSAEYLRFLADRFGNLGLAAAAYNAGEGRVASWQRRGGNLPSETRNYVRIITGLSVDDWHAGETEEPDFALQPDQPFGEACLTLASTRPVPKLPSVSTTWQPWGVLIAQDYSPSVALDKFEREKRRYAAVFGDEATLTLSVRNPKFGPKPRHSVQLGRGSRKDAEATCAKLRAAGGSCVVVKN